MIEFILKIYEINTTEKGHVTIRFAFVSEREHYKTFLHAQI